MNSNNSFLDTLQKHTLDLFNNGFNLFLTGSAGTGKSYFVKELVKQYLKQYPSACEEIVVTSTTGLSSLNINGKTLHSWAGINPKHNLQDPDAFILEVRQKNKLLNNWLYTKVLIIDEISMLEANLLDFLNQVARSLRASSKPFGGIQLVLTGDFYQLPPVTNLSGEKIPYCFKAECWTDLVDYTISLKKNHRQEEKQLIKFLNYLRVGTINNYVLKQLELYHQNPNYSDDYSHLYPNKVNVENHNLMKLNQLDGELSCYSARLITKANKSPEYTHFPKDSVIVENLLLKPGAFVILNKNVDASRGLVNGLQGIFQSMTREGSALIKTRDGHFHQISKARWEFNNFYVEQYPLRLAWAITIHKSQGMSIERLSVDIGDNIFSEGQVYVALSRAVSSKYLHIQNYSQRAILVNKQVNEFYQNISEGERKWIKYQGEEGEEGETGGNSAANSQGGSEVGSDVGSDVGSNGDSNSNNDNRSYYENSISGVTSWKLPKDAFVIKTINSVEKDERLDNQDKVDNVYKVDKIENDLTNSLATWSQQQLIGFILSLDKTEVLNDKISKFLEDTNKQDKSDSNNTDNSNNSNNSNNSSKLTTSKTSKTKKDQKLCHICEENHYLIDYFEFLDERVCQACCSGNSDYRLMSKQELYSHFKGQVTQRQISTILENSFYKPQKNVVNPRFKPTRLFMLGHIKSEVEKLKQVFTSTSNNNNNNTSKSSKTNIEANEIHKNTFIKYFKENNSFSQIAEYYGVASRTAESYLYKYYLSNSDQFLTEHLQKLGVSIEITRIIRGLVDIWKKNNKGILDEYPKLRYLRAKLPASTNYLAIKIILFSLYSYQAN